MKQSVYDLRTIQVLCQREVLRTFKEPSRMLGVVVQPLVFWFVIGSGFMPNFRMNGTDEHYLAFFYPGVLAMVLLFTAIFSTITLIEDRASGLMQAVLVAPAHRYALVLGKVLGIVSIALLQGGLFLCAAPFSGVSLAAVNWPFLFVVMMLGSLVLALWGFVVAWWLDSSTAYHAFMSIFLIPLWIVSGAMFPVTQGWMKVVAACNPEAWLVSALRVAFAGEAVANAALPLFLLVVSGVILLMVAVGLCDRRR